MQHVLTLLWIKGESWMDLSVAVFIYALDPGHVGLTVRY